MKRERVSFYQPLFFAFAASALFCLISIVPSHASALEVSTQTVQLLPPGTNTCAQIQVTNFTPYIYDNELNSFEFTVSDASYVAIVGSVGNTPIPLRQMVRLASASGGVRIHVDINSTPLNVNVPIVVTLLSASTGKPLCASVVTTSLGSGSATVSIVPVSQTPVVVHTPVSPTIITHTPTTSTTTASSTVVAPVVNILQGPFKDLCASQASAFRLWLILLVLYTIVVGGLLWLEFPISWAWAQTAERVAIAILGLLVLLLGFWYFSAACRAALWMPLVAFLVAVLGLLAAFWNHPKIVQLLLIEEPKLPPVVPTPPSSSKK